MFDKNSKLSFPTADGRELILSVNTDSGFASITETIDGEEETISFCTTEIKTIATYISLLEEQAQKLHSITNLPFTAVV